MIRSTYSMTRIAGNRADASARPSAPLSESARMVSDAGVFAIGIWRIAPSPFLNPSHCLISPLRSWGTEHDRPRSDLRNGPYFTNPRVPAYFCGISKTLPRRVATAILSTNGCRSECRGSRTEVPVRESGRIFPSTAAVLTFEPPPISTIGGIATAPGNESIK
jgi:hypothetical protein